MTLNSRERTILGAGLVVVVAVLVLELVIDPWTERRDTLSRAVPRREDQLGQVRRDAAEYRRLQAGLEELRRRIRERPANFSLLSFVEDIARRRQLLDNVSNTGRTIMPVGDEYQRVHVDLELKGVTLDQALGLLEDLQTAPTPVTIDLLEVGHSRDRQREQFLDVTLGVSLLRPKPTS